MADSLRTKRADEQKHHCEPLYVQGRIDEVAEPALEMENTTSEDVRANKLRVNWLSGTFRRHAVQQGVFTPPSELRHRCIATLGRWYPTSAEARGSTG